MFNCNRFVRWLSTDIDRICIVVFLDKRGLFSISMEYYVSYHKALKIKPAPFEKYKYYYLIREE